MKYTFNGWGEYTLMIIEEIGFSIQVRMLPYRNLNAPTQGTVFTGIAIRANATDDIQLELNDGILLGINGRITDSDANDFSLLLNGAYIQRSNNTFTFLYDNEISVKIEIDNTQSFFYILMTVPSFYQNKTRGLLGVMDNNVENEFTLPNGNVLSIDPANDRDIFNRFGSFWKTSPANTIFTYYTGYSHASFKNDNYLPLFLSDGITFQNSTLETLARAKCGSNMECLFDVSTTGQLTVGESTLTFTQDISNLKEELSSKIKKLLLDKR